MALINYVDEFALRFELTAVNLATAYKKTKDQDLVEKYNKRKEERIQEIKEVELTQEKLENSKREFLENELKRLETLTIEKQNKEIMGDYILKITSNLSKKSCFVGYTLNWKDEFYSKAIQHCFQYIHNFDENKISKRSGQKIKAFAYITQIIYTSFLNVITDRKKEQERLRQTISMEENINSINNSNSNIYSSTYNNELRINLETLDIAQLQNIRDDLKSYKKLRNELIDYKQELYLAETFKGKKDDYFQQGKVELENTLKHTQDKIKELEKKYKIKQTPEIIKISCLSYTKDDTTPKLSEALRMFEDLGFITQIKENEKQSKKDNDNFEDF